MKPFVGAASALPLVAGTSRAFALATASAVLLACGSHAASNSSEATRASDLRDAPGAPVIESAWTTRSPMPTPRNAFGIAALNGQIFVMGGWINDATHDGVTDVVEVYDTQTDTWETRARMPTPRNALAAVALGGKIYAIGGWDGTAITSAVEIYDPRTDTWSVGPPLEVPNTAVSAAVLNGRIYVAGGDRMEVYDPRTKSWATTASHNWFPRFLLALAVAHGKLYALGGTDTPDPLAVQDFYPFVQSYDPATDSWTYEQPMLFGRTMHGAAVIGDTVYVVGGTNWRDVAYGPFLSSVEAFTPATGRWAPIGPLGNGRNAISAVAVNGSLYAIGGWDWNGPSSTVEQYTERTATVVLSGDECVMWDWYGPGWYTVTTDTKAVVPQAAPGSVEVTCRANVVNPTGDWMVLRSEDYPGLTCFVFNDWLPPITTWEQVIAPNGDATLVCRYPTHAGPGRSDAPGCAIVDGGVVSWWPAHGPTDVAGPNDGSASGDLGFENGRVGAAFRFDGATSYVEAGDAGMPLGGEARTLEFWMKPDYDARYPFIYGGLAETDAFYAIVIGPNVCIGQWGGGDLCGLRNVVDGAWHHVALTYANQIATLYLDGTEEVTWGGKVYSTTSTGHAYLGSNFAFSGAPDFFRGLVDEVTVYDRVVGAREIRAIFDAGPAGKCIGPALRGAAGLYSRDAVLSR